MQMFEKVSVQRCESASVEQDSFDRLGSKAIYAFVYPNFMINRYPSYKKLSLNFFFFFDLVSVKKLS